MCFVKGWQGAHPQNKNPIGPLLGHEFVDDVFARVPDVRGLERGRREVQLEGLPGLGIPVESEHHVHSSILEAAAGSATAREEVEHLHSGAGGGFAVRFVFARWIHGRGGAVAGWIVKHSHNVKGQDRIGLKLAGRPDAAVEPAAQQALGGHDKRRTRVCPPLWAGCGGQTSW